MKVLVTGGSGFIGTHVVRALRKSGHIAIVLDIAPPRFHANVFADITQPLPRGAPLDDLDAVIHLAALANPRECDANPAKAFNVNVNGTHQVLKMALESGAKKFVFSSSAHVYDIPPRYMPTDEVHPLRLNNTYTTTKILGEQLCQLYFENHGLSYTTLRLFNAYGKGQGLGYFIPDMVKKAESGFIDVKGANTTKDFVHVEDVARAFVLALDTDFVGPINIGTGVETALAEVVRVIVSGIRSRADSVGAAIDTNFIYDADPTRMQADRNRAAKVLGWAPAINIWEGLRAVIGAAEKVAV